MSAIGFARNPEDGKHTIGYFLVIEIKSENRFEYRILNIANYSYATYRTK